MKKYWLKILKKGAPIIGATILVLVIVILLVNSAAKKSPLEELLVPAATQAPEVTDIDSAETITPPLYDASSTEDIVYVKPQTVYEDDLIKIETISYVENMIYGKGIIMRYTNKTKSALKIALAGCRINDQDLAVPYERDIPTMITDTFYYDPDELTGKLQGCELEYIVTQGLEQHSTGSITIK